MKLNWSVKVRWAGNLQNVPLAGRVVDYRQHNPGLIEVTIVCENQKTLLEQIDLLTGPRDYCSGMQILPYFESIGVLEW
jgi:hypothetical protein